MEVSNYSSDSIKVLKGLEAVKKRPGMYTETSRPNHLALEVIDNSIDEALAGYATTIDVQYPSVDEENCYYQIGFMPIIEDRQVISNADNKSVISIARILIQKILDQFLLHWVENP